MNKIGVCWDDGLPDNKCFADFKGVEGIDGDHVVDQRNEIYQLKLYGGILNQEFQEFLAKGRVFPRFYGHI